MNYNLVIYCFLFPNSCLGIHKVTEAHRFKLLSQMHCNSELMQTLPEGGESETAHMSASAGQRET